MMIMIEIKLSNRDDEDEKDGGDVFFSINAAFQMPTA